MSPRTPRGAARRDEILSVAIQVCSASGHGDASLREIAEAAHIKKGLLTYYFPTKEALLFAIGDDMHRQYNALMDEWLSREFIDPFDRLAGLFEAHVLQTCRLVEQVRVSYETVRHLSAPHREAIRSSREHYSAGLASMIDACRPQGWVDDAPTPSLVVAALSILNWVYVWYRPGPRQPAEIAAEVTARALATLGPPPRPLA